MMRCCARLLFLTSSQVLRVLCEVKLPGSEFYRALPSLFPGVEGLEVSPESEIFSLQSGMGQCLQLLSPIKISSFNGCVEKWILQVNLKKHTVFFSPSVLGVNVQKSQT